MRYVGIILMFTVVGLSPVQVLAEVVFTREVYHWDSSTYLDDEETLAAMAWYEQEDETEESASAAAKKLMLVQWGRVPLDLIYSLLEETVIEQNFEVDAVRAVYEVLRIYDWSVVNAKYAHYVFTTYDEDEILSLYKDAVETSGQRQLEIHKELYVKLDELLREEIVKTLEKMKGM